MTARQLHSVEAEQAVLGALMIDGERMDSVADVLTEADFFSADHAFIFGAMLGLSTAGKPIDARTLCDWLEREQTLEGIGGLPYLLKLLESTPSAANVRHYAKIVRDHRIERQLRRTGEQLGALSIAAGPVAPRLDQAQSLIMALTETASVNEPQRIGALLHPWIEALEARLNSPAPLLGLSTSIKDLDAITAGLHPGQLIIIAGRPGMGKSAIALQMANYNALQGDPMAFFTLEMSRDEYVERSVVNAGRLDNQKVRTGKNLGGDDWERISAAVGRLNEAPIYIDDSAEATVAQIRAKARRLQRTKGIKGLVVDYLQLMNGTGDSRREEVDSISRGLKLLAKELGIPVIALAQLNRGLEQRANKRPMLSDLRESGSLEQDADVVLFLYRDEVYNDKTDDRGGIEMIVAKQRMGPPGTIRGTWIGEHYAVADRAGDWVAPPPKAVTNQTVADEQQF